MARLTVKEPEPFHPAEETPETGTGSDSHIHKDELKQSLSLPGEKTKMCLFVALVENQRKHPDETVRANLWSVHRTKTFL